VRNGFCCAIFQGHSTLVEAASFSSDSALIVTASADWTAKLWNQSTELWYRGTEHQSTAQIVQSFVGHEGGVEMACFSPDDLMVTTCSRDRTARLWCVSSGATLHILRGHQGRVCSSIFMPPPRYPLSLLWQGPATSSLRLGCVDWRVMKATSWHGLPGIASHCGKLPWLLCGLAHHESDVVALIARDCLPLFDDTPDRLKNTHHPLAVALLKPGGRGRVGVEALAGGVPLAALPEDFQAVIGALKLIPAAEQIIEGAHMNVKRAVARLPQGTGSSLSHRTAPRP
jgi:hypothetical protein